MSELNTEQFLDFLQRQGGSQNVDLAGRDLSEIDLSGDALEELLEEMGYANGAGGGNKWPSWFEPWTKGVSLSRANLRRVRLRMADLRNACMEGADLRDADLTGAFLQDATLEEADLRHTNFTGAVFSHTILWAKFPSLEGCYLYGTHIQFTPCSRDQFGEGVGEELDRDWLRAREVYLTLRHNFLDLGRYADASWAYRKERRMERAAAFPSEEGDRWVRDEMPKPRSAWTRWMPDWLLERLLYARLYLAPPRGVPLKRWQHVGNLLQGATCEYGENPWRLGWWLLGSLGVFSALYFVLDLVAPQALILASAPGEVESFFSYLAFSLASTAAMNFLRLEPVSTVGMVLASLQSVIGISIFALFMFTLGRSMSGE